MIEVIVVIRIPTITTLKLQEMKVVGGNAKIGNAMRAGSTAMLAGRNAIMVGRRAMMAGSNAVVLSMPMTMITKIRR